MPDVAMPRLSDSMEEGTIHRWLKASGDAVRRGDELVEIETDKANLTYEAESDGVLEIVAAEGDKLEIGALIARIGGGGAPPPPEPPAEPVGVAEVAEAPVAEAAPVRSAAKGEATVQEPTRAQQLVARRTAEAKATVPELVLSAEVDMTAAAEVRAQLDALAREAGRPVPTFDDLVVKATALALREVPLANAAYRDGRFERYARVNVGIMIAGPDGPVTPTLFDADVRPLPELAAERHRLTGRVRGHATTSPELAGATFTVSSLDGVRAFTGVLTPPQAGILAVGEVADRPAVRDGALTVCPTVHLTLTCDHRILHGTDAAALLRGIRDRLERPLALVVPGV